MNKNDKNVFINALKYTNDYGGPNPCLNFHIESINIDDIKAIYQFLYSDSRKSLICKTSVFKTTKLSDFSTESNKYLIEFKGEDERNRFNYVLCDEINPELKALYKIIDVDKEVVFYD